MNYNPLRDDVPPGFVAKADQWSAFIRNWAEEIQEASFQGTLDPDEMAKRMAFGIATDICNSPGEVVAFAMHCLMAIAANIPAEELEFP